jgi:recombination protein RecT
MSGEVQLRAGSQIANKQTAVALVNSFRERIAAVLVSEVRVKKFVGVVMNCFSRNEALYRCTQESVMRCVLACAELDLWPGTPLQHAHLIPYGNDCTLNIGFRGYLELVNRSGQIGIAWAEVVREGDEFSVVKGTDPKLHHVPHADSDAPITHAYAVAKTLSGFTTSEVMDLKEIEEVKACSRAASKKGSIWEKWYGEMARKTVLRRLCKRLPMSEAMRAAEDYDNDQYDMKDADVVREKRPLLTPEELKRNIEMRDEMRADGATEATPQRVRQQLESRYVRAAEALSEAGGEPPPDMLEDLSDEALEAGAASMLGMVESLVPPSAK